MTEPLPTQREGLVAALEQDREFDVAIVGGGATGLGVALDAAARDFSVVLVESMTLPKEHHRARPSWCTAVCAT
jgi:glycerol-3-phosphate dehydrogenase